MDLSTLFRTKENLNLDKNTLTILRYIAIIGQFIAVNIVYHYLKLDFPINEILSIYAKGSAFYTFGRRSFVRVSGTTDQVNDEGENITAFERVNFADPRLDLKINDQLISNVQSPFLHYNMNSVLIQLGITLSFSSLGTY